MAGYYRNPAAERLARKRLRKLRVQREQISKFLGEHDASVTYLLPGETRKGDFKAWQQTGWKKRVLAFGKNSPKP